MSFGDGCQKLIIYIKAGKVELHAVGFLFFVPRWHLLTLSFGSRQCGVKASDYIKSDTAPSLNPSVNFSQFNFL